MSEIHIVQNKEETTEGLRQTDGLILSVMDYKEHDGLVTLATENQLFKVLARGIQKENSKNRRLMMPFTCVSINYDPKYSREFLFLINGTVLESFWKCSQSLEIQTISDLLCSLIIRHGIHPELYRDLRLFWSFVQNDQEKNALLAACKAMCEILLEAGTLMNVDECTICESTKQIAGVSMAEGGFVCLNHLGEEMPWPKENLLLLRRLVRYPLDKLLRQPLRPDYAFLIYLFEWYEYTADTRLKSLKFLKTLLEMPDPKKKAS